MSDNEGDGEGEERETVKDAGMIFFFLEKMSEGLNSWKER